MSLVLELEVNNLITRDLKIELGQIDRSLIFKRIILKLQHS